MKKFLILLLCFMLVFAAAPNVFADETDETTAPIEGESDTITYLLVSSSLNAPQNWYAWTWGKQSGRWIKGEKDSSSDKIFLFKNLDEKVVFASMYSADTQPSWDANIMWKQSVDIILDGVHDTVYLSEIDSEGKLTGILTNYTSPTQVTQPTETGATAQTEPYWTEPTETTQQLTQPTVATEYTLPTQATQATEATQPTQQTQRPTGHTEPTVIRPTEPTEPTETAQVTVSTKPPTTQPATSAPKLNLKTATVKCGKVITLKISNRGKSKVTYSSNNTKVAKVSSAGKVTALKKGVARITVKVGANKLYFTIKVTTSPKLSKSSVTIKKGKYKYVTIIGKASTVNNVYTNTKKAKILSKKNATKLKVKALKKGSTTLKVKVNGVVLKLKVKVT